MSDDGSAHLFVGGCSWPKVGWCPASNARYPPKRRYAKLLVFLDEEEHPALQVVEEPVKLGMQRVIPRNLSVCLLHVLYDIDNLAQELI